MKIVLAAKSVYPFHPVGGVQKYVYNFAKYLQRAGVDLEIVAPLDATKKRSATFEGLKYTFLPPAIYWYLEYPIGWLGVHLFSHSLARYLKSISFDVLHSFDMTGYQYFKVKNRRPALAHIFTDNYLTNPIGAAQALELTASKFDQIKHKKVIISPFADAAMRRRYFLQYHFKIKPMHYCLSAAQKVCFEADIFKNEVCDIYKIPMSRGEILPVGVDIDFIDDNLKKYQKSKEYLGFGKDDIVLLTVNRLAADKGVDKILLALAKIRHTNSKVKLVIIGQGYQEEEIKKLIDENHLTEHVRHFKNVDEKDLYGFYRLADMYICAFSYPGSSLSTLEAMACGLPVLTTAQPWLIKDNGFLIADNDPATLEKSIMEMINEGRLKQKGEISRKIAEEYAWPRVAQKAIEIYQSVLRK